MSDLKDAWNRINSMIRPGDIGGNGCDKTAERNGLILAANAVMEMIDGPLSPPTDAEVEVVTKAYGCIEPEYCNEASATKCDECIWKARAALDAFLKARRG